MKILNKICQYLIYALGLFFIIMAFDMFDPQYTWWEKIFGFLVSILPGVVIILLNYLLRKKQLILGVILLAAGIFFFFFFRFHQDFGEKIITVLTVELPIIFSGIIFILSRNRYD